MDFNIEKKVKQTLSKIKLNKNEKILVALSGGKDSSVTAYLLNKLGYNIEGFHIDLGMGKYSEKCLKAVKELGENLKMKIHIYDIKKEMGSSMCYLRSAIQSQKSLKNCAICGVFKKWIMNKEARKLKADKIATGHNLDDESQTFLINIFKGSPELSLNIGAISREIKNTGFIPRIKPLFYIPEEEVRGYSKKNKLPVIYEKCPCALDSYRIQVRKFVKKLSDKNKKNIIKNSQKILKNFVESIGRESFNINYCEICGEPCRDKICKRCQLMEIKG